MLLVLDVNWFVSAAIFTHLYLLYFSLTMYTPKTGIILVQKVLSTKINKLNLRVNLPLFLNILTYYILPLQYRHIRLV